MECEIYNKVAKKKLLIKDYVKETYLTDGKPKGNYFFIKLDGLGEVQADRHVMNSNIDGSIYMDSTLAERVIQIELIMLADEQQTLETLRREISHIINPKSGILELHYKEENKHYRINVASDHVPTFTTADYLSSKGQRVTLTLVASDPFWYDTTSEVHYLAKWQPNFEWDLEFPMINQEESGIELEVLDDAGLVELENKGDQQTGMVMLLTASGDVRNPEIIKVISDGSETQRMQLNIDMKSGDMIRINTTSGQKRVEKWHHSSAKWVNIFNLLSLNSHFIQLDVGKNYLRYQAEQYEELLEIKIQYELCYVGV